MNVFSARATSLATVALILIASLSLKASAQTSPGNLAGTSWQLVQFQGSDGTTRKPDDKTKYTVAFETGNRVSVRFDCNRGTGTWSSEAPGQLRFGNMAITQAACLSLGSLHDRIARDFMNLRTYVLKDGHLFLSLMANGGAYEFEPMTKTQTP
jgi:para-nitrobenzyl esterase